MSTKRRWIVAVLVTFAILPALGAVVMFARIDARAETVVGTVETQGESIEELTQALDRVTASQVALSATVSDCIENPESTCAQRQAAALAAIQRQLDQLRFDLQEVITEGRRFGRPPAAPAAPRPAPRPAPPAPAPPPPAPAPEEPADDPNAGKVCILDICI